MQAKFVHLRVHTEYSLVDGIVRIKPLIEKTRKFAMPAVAITDHCNLFALVKFYRTAQAGGVKALIGADVLVRNPDHLMSPFLLTLLVQNETGYQSLTKLLSLAYQEGQYQGIPMLNDDWLRADNAGLIALSGGRDGALGQALLGKISINPGVVLESWKKIFDGRFYIELQRTNRSRETQYISDAVQLAVDFNVPVVATNDVRFLNQEDYDAHEIRVCVNQGRTLDDPRRLREYSEYQYLRSAEEMELLFSDLPEALENTVEIAKRCNLTLKLGKNYLPDFPVPKETTMDQYFVEQSHLGLKDRLNIRAKNQSKDNSEATQTEYRNRLDMELKVILQMGFPGYFLIVADFIQWAKNNHIPVGPGRGSGAGSLVAYALKITDLDPIEFDLLFERFLNPERVSMPDFDVDFCMERRDRVIEYVANKYGRDRVSQIITYGTMAARAVVRDVGRVLGHGYGFVDRLAKSIPFELGMTLEKALDESEDLKNAYEHDEDVKTLIDLAKSLEGITRNAGKHAGGVVISPSKLTDFTPLYCEPSGENLVTQFDKDDVEAVGLVKFDFLGLRTLTIIDWAVETINHQCTENNREPIDITEIPLDDTNTYELLSRYATTAVFQLESRGMKDLIKRLQPDCFEDVIALVALFRPGPLQSGMVDDYINVKHGRAEAEYAHPVLEPILKPTNGVILYQEQVMEIARELAGYSLGGADLLRRAMGKKKPEEMAKQRSIFTEGAISRGVEESTATYIFDLMEKFAGYGFNKSHSAAYALIAYQTAWLKTYYPSEFMAAVLSADMDNTDKVVTLTDECREMCLEILPPDINRSSYRFAVANQSEIVYGLGAIKGVGQAAIEEILNEQASGHAFKNLQDFCYRIDLRKANRRVLEALIQAGAFDRVVNDRAQAMAELPVALKTAEQQGRMDQTGQDDLFGLNVEGDEKNTEHVPIVFEPWSEARRLAAEKATLGLYLTGHPINQYVKEISNFTHGRLSSLTIDSVRSNTKPNIRVAGLVIEIRTRQTKTKKNMAFVTLDDRSGRIEVAVFTEAFEKYHQLLSKDNILVAEGNLGVDDFSGNLRLTAERLFNIDQARGLFARRLVLHWHDDATLDKRGSGRRLIRDLQNLIAPFQGGNCPVCIHYITKSARSRIQLGNEWYVHPGDELIHRLEKFLGPNQVKLDYTGISDNGKAE